MNRARFNAGDLALVDLNRVESQRVQFESDYETAYVGVRTAKIQLLMLLNQRTPLEQFDGSGPFDFSPELMPLEEFRAVALANRPPRRVIAALHRFAPQSLRGHPFSVF